MRDYGTLIEDFCLEIEPPFVVYTFCDGLYEGGIQKVNVFVVTDASIFGRGLFGVFSTLEKAILFKEELERQNTYSCEIKRHVVMGSRIAGGQVFAAHVYDELYDMHMLDGLYSDRDYAVEAVGVKGLIVEFVIDMPEKTLILSST